MKKILIVNGNPKIEMAEFDEYLEQLKGELINQGNEVKLMNLRGKNISDCIGCYGCWLKTPGICVLKDDQEEVLKSFIRSDFILLSSPIIMGFVSSLIKKSIDRLIPLVHPFLLLKDDRMSHYPRYDKDLKMALLIDKNVVNEDDIEINRKLFGGIAFIKTMNDSIKEVSNEINNF